MMNKYGINQIHAKKSGPIVKNAIGRYSKKLYCPNCQAEFETDCGTEDSCERFASSCKCTKCGTQLLENK